MNWRSWFPGAPKGAWVHSTRAYGPGKLVTVVRVPRRDGLTETVSIQSDGRGGINLKDGVPSKLGLTDGVRHGPTNDGKGHAWRTNVGKIEFRDTRTGTMSRYGVRGRLETNARISMLVRDTSAFAKALQSSANRTLSHATTGTGLKAQQSAASLLNDMKGQKSAAGKILRNLETQNKQTLKLARNAEPAVKARTLSLHRTAEVARVTAAKARVTTVMQATAASVAAAKLVAATAEHNRIVAAASSELAKASAKVAQTQAGTAARITALEAEKAARIALEEAQKNAQRAIEAARITAQQTAEAARVAAHTAAVTTVEASRAAALAAGAVVGAAVGAVSD